MDSRFYAIVTDLVSTPRELVDSRGAITWRSQSALWGTTTWHTDSTTYTPLRFPGQYHDPETGLPYNYFRYYDPPTARYVTPDPLGLDPAPNNTTYVHNPVEHREQRTQRGCRAPATSSGSLARPGHFYPHEVNGPTHPGVQSAYEWGLRKSADSPASVLIGRMPEETYQKLISQGHVTVREVGEGVPPETIFHPDSFPELNKAMQWMDPITPGR
ncbi:RHS domain-containing protein [Streptomyces oryzae]|uniref:RHS domain-containing protein n=1 Tax=Streptomyces oryzae TaxID=1434886 RepID=A0ABS3XBS3_9ACTN|nr:RHS domain-containing protein [Streptomyces oryzae]